ncbi:hypothetical protein DV736_g2512, partial [Chaetothyriales sp. CBS 134916]
MTIFTSSHPPLTYPTDLTIWEWLFEPSLSAASPFRKAEGEFLSQAEPLGAYVNAVTQESLSFEMVRQHAIRLSQALHAVYGIGPGDTVTLFSTNTIWYPVAMWAVLRLGGRVNGASPAYTVEEMVHAMKTARTKLVFTLARAIGVVGEAAERVGLGREKVLVLDGDDGGTAAVMEGGGGENDCERGAVVSLQDLVKVEGPRGEEEEEVLPHWRIQLGKTNKEVCGFLNFSSGTTGLPKAVMLSHHNVIAQCMQLQQLQVMPDRGVYSILAVMPLFHITGLVRFCTYPVLMNGYSYMLPSYTLKGMLEAICAYQIEELILVPPILIRLVRDAIVQQYDLTHVKRWSSGSAPIAPEVIKALQAKFPSAGFRQGYGATESTACITCHPPSHFDYKYATTGGKLVANTEAKVLSLEDGKRVLGIGETGEICARGPQIAMGYLDNEEATRQTFQDGWLHTGDVGHFDAEGLVHVEDRIKEMIKVKGLQVPPAELEDLLLGHEMVEDCAVTGVRDEWAGERPKAFVVLKKGIAENETTGRVLLEFVKQNKVRYKWLVEVEFVDEVPKNATGKLLRRVLKLREKEGRQVGLRVREGEKARL